jgi:hypothetical protein
VDVGRPRRAGELDPGAELGEAEDVDLSERGQAEKAKQVALLILDELRSQPDLKLITVAWKSTAGPRQSLTMLYNFTPDGLRSNLPRTSIN